MHRLKTTIFIALILLSFRASFAAPVTADTAAKAVQGWLRQDHRPLGARLSSNVKRTETVKDTNGAALYYVVHLQPAGFVILSADDAAEPIVAFSASGSFDSSSGSTLAKMVNYDLPKRLAQARSPAKASATTARSKWNAFLAGSLNPPPDSDENGSIVVVSQIRVAPFIQTLWNQQTDVSLNDACYNYYTPPGSAGDPANDPCGCVATALAQTMFYYKWPSNGVGITTFVVTNNGAPMNTSLLGGNGAGGPYQWTNMPLSPDSPTTIQAMAIGALTHDAGAAVNMMYTSNNSSAYSVNAQQALVNTFQFATADYYENDSSGLSGTPLLNMVNPNLDARLPVILGIQPDGGHCLLCDGYGYSSSTLFHHLNTGWGGDNDIWYALPNVDTADSGDFTLVNACIYNIFPTGTGQIISGQVTDPTGAPIVGATVTATAFSIPTSTTTDSNGVYAFSRTRASATYALTVSKPGNSSASGSYTTESSSLNQLPSGNVWGADFVLSPALLTIPETGFSSVGLTNGPFSVISQIYNLTNSSAVAINWNISNPSTWLSVSATNGLLPAGSVTNFTVTLNSIANTLAAGAYSGSIWISNLGNAVGQPLQFSLSVYNTNFPIAVTGYNLDVIVEADAVGGNTFNYADTFDPVNPIPGTNGGPACFYETNLVVTNIFGSDASDTGLPASGLFTSEFDHGTVFQLGPYDGENVLYLTYSNATGSLNLATPAIYNSLSVLAASAQGGGSGTMVIHFSDGSSSALIPFNATNYLTTNTPSSGAALTNFGMLVIGQFNEFYSLDNGYQFPTLYQTTVDLAAAGLNNKMVTAVTFTMPATNAAAVTTNTVTGVFALSGTAAPYTGDYTVSVSPSPSDGGTVSGGGPFPAGSTNTVTATAIGNFAFVNWTEGGVVVSTSTNYTFIVNGNETLTANFTENFTVTLNASPAGGGSVSGGGTFAVGSLATLTAMPSNGYAFTGWTGDISSGNDPLIITVLTNLNLTATFAPNGVDLNVTVRTNIPAYGSVTPNLNGKILTLGRNYTLTATPVAGALFSSWTGGIVTNKNPLTFKAETNMLIEAVFVPNPFLPVKGTYNGLFAVSNSISETTAGMLRSLIIGPKGTYSGSLLINGTVHGISGSFNLNGLATNVIKRTAAQGGSLTLQMTLPNSDTPAPQLTGTVAGTSWTATLTADLAADAVPTGQYTLLVPPGNNTVSPAGDGYALIDNDAGTVRITGDLADGTPLSQTVTVSENGYVPIYASLYSGKGLLTGWINLSSNLDNTGLTWIRPGARTGLYTNGFANTLSAGQLLLSQWSEPGNFDLLTNITIFDTNMPVSVTGSGKVTGQGVSGSIAPKTGVVTLSIGSGSSRVTAHGALLNPTNGGGYFLTKTNAQGIEFGP